jgi:ABC-type uncharacterized transport system auxiliary subunit
MAPTGNAKPSLNIEVARLRPADALSGNAIVVRRSEHELDTYPLDTWASNIGELASEKLTAEFGDHVPERATLELTGDVIAFEQAGANEARAAFAIDIRKKGASRYEEPLLAKTYSAQSPIEGEVTPALVVAALSRATENIAQQIAVDVNALDMNTEIVPAKRETLHTLDMTPSGKAKARMNINVTALRRSDALGRNSILIRPNATSVEYFLQDRWASNVSNLVAEKLEAEFGAPETGRETVQVTGNIVAFERLDSAQGAAGHVKLDATLQGDGEGARQRPLLWKVYEATAPAENNSAAAVAVALSRALEEVAVSIAADAERIPPAPAKADAPEVHLYTIDMKSSGTVQCKHNVVFERIQPNDSLTRADILIVRNETLVDRYEHDRWASGLAELVPEKLTAEFGPSQESRKTVLVSGVVSGFEQIVNGAGSAALVKMNLVLRWADVVGEAPALRKSYEATAPLEGEGAHAAVKALSRATEAIAVKIAEDVNTLPEPVVPEVQTPPAAK